MVSQEGEKMWRKGKWLLFESLAVVFVLVQCCAGFTVVQWWASVGMVSCYWLAGKESMAEDYYPNIEALSGEMGAAVPSALQLAFKANRMYRRPSSRATKVPALQVVIQLCATTSNALEGSVANLLQDHSNSTETELHQVIGTFPVMLGKRWLVVC